MSRAREHIRSNIVGYLALFLVLAGTAYALPGRNTVDSGDIRNGQVKTADIRNNNVRGADIRAGAVGGTDVGDSSLTGADVADDSLTDADIDATTLSGVNANRLNGRVVCDVNRRLTVNNSSNLADEETVCILGPFEIKVFCDAGGGGSVTADIDVVNSANGTAFAGGVMPQTINAGARRTIVDLSDGTENNISVVSPSHPFSIWTVGGTLMVGQAAARADTRTDDTRICDFSMFATG